VRSGLEGEFRGEKTQVCRSTFEVEAKDETASSLEELDS
jgi:hypothetical protein